MHPVLEAYNRLLDATMHAYSAARTWNEHQTFHAEERTPSVQIGCDSEGFITVNTSHHNDPTSNHATLAQQRARQHTEKAVEHLATHAQHLTDALAALPFVLHNHLTAWMTLDGQHRAKHSTDLPIILDTTKVALVLHAHESTKARAMAARPCSLRELLPGLRALLLLRPGDAEMPNGKPSSMPLWRVSEAHQRTTYAVVRATSPRTALLMAGACVQRKLLNPHNTIVIDHIIEDTNTVARQVFRDVGSLNLDTPL